MAQSALLCYCGGGTCLFQEDNLNIASQLQDGLERWTSKDIELYYKRRFEVIQQIHRLNNTLDPPLIITIPEVKGTRSGKPVNPGSPLDDSWMLTTLSQRMENPHLIRHQPGTSQPNSNMSKRTGPIIGTLKIGENRWKRPATAIEWNTLGEQDRERDYQSNEITVITPTTFEETIPNMYAEEGYPCICGISYRWRSSLRRHYTTVHKNGRYTCPFCAGPYASPIELQMHMADRVKRGGCGVRMIDTRPPVVSRARVYERLVKSGYIGPNLTTDCQRRQESLTVPYNETGRGGLTTAGRPTPRRRRSRGRETPSTAPAGGKRNSGYSDLRPQYRKGKTDRGKRTPTVTTTWVGGPEGADSDSTERREDQEDTILEGLNTPESSFRSEEETEADTIPYGSEHSEPESPERK